MRVLFPRIGESGKGQFLGRLKPWLEAEGVRVLHDPGKPHDINVGFSTFKHKTKARKVLRLDGVYYSKKAGDKNKNKKIRTHMESADGIIYQSEFSRKVCNQFLGEPKCATAMIRNGANRGFSDVKRGSAPYNFLAVARWRKFKRLPMILEAFQKLDREDTRLWVCGDGCESKNIPRVKFQGRVPSDGLVWYYVMAHASIHVSWIDSCPNSVVEAICYGVPVVCNNVGGTPELVKDSGIICKIDTPYNFDRHDQYSFPDGDVDALVQGMSDVLDRRSEMNMDRPDLDARYVAREYKRFFEKVLG